MFVCIVIICHCSLCVVVFSCVMFWFVLSCCAFVVFCYDLLCVVDGNIYNFHM